MKRILIALIFTALVITAAAAADASFNVLVYPKSNEIESYISTFFPSRPSNDDVWAGKQEREARQELKKLGEALVSAYESENQEKISSASRLLEDGVSASQAPATDLEVRLIDAGKLSFDVDAMISDPVLMSYICDVADADIVVVPVSDYLQGFLHLSLYIYRYGSDSVEMVYEMISKESDRYPVNSALALAPQFLDEKPALVRLEGLASGTVVEIDGKVAGSLDSYVMTTAGKHVRATSPRRRASSFSPSSRRMSPRWRRT